MLTVRSSSVVRVQNQFVMTALSDFYCFNWHSNVDHTEEFGLFHSGSIDPNRLIRYKVLQTLKREILKVSPFTIHKVSIKRLKVRKTERYTIPQKIEKTFYISAKGQMITSVFLGLNECSSVMSSRRGRIFSFVIFYQAVDFEIIMRNSYISQ